MRNNSIDPDPSRRPPRDDRASVGANPPAPTLVIVMGRRRRPYDERRSAIAIFGTIALVCFGIAAAIFFLPPF